MNNYFDELALSFYFVVSIGVSFRILQLEKKYEITILDCAKLSGRHARCFW